MFEYVIAQTPPELENSFQTHLQGTVFCTNTECRDCPWGCFLYCWLSEVMFFLLFFFFSRKKEYFPVVRWEGKNCSLSLLKVTWPGWAHGFLAATIAVLFPINLTCRCCTGGLLWEEEVCQQPVLGVRGKGESVWPSSGAVLEASCSSDSKKN